MAEEFKAGQTVYEKLPHGGGGKELTIKEIIGQGDEALCTVGSSGEVERYDLFNLTHKKTPEMHVVYASKDDLKRR